MNAFGGIRVSIKYSGIQDKNTLRILGSGMRDAVKSNEGIRSGKQKMAPPL